MRTINVYNARSTRTARSSMRFTVWKVLNRSGIGVEEIHFLDADGIDPFDPGAEPWEIVGDPSFQVFVEESDIEP